MRRHKAEKMDMTTLVWNTNQILLGSTYLSTQIPDASLTELVTLLGFCTPRLIVSSWSSLKFLPTDPPPPGQRISALPIFGSY
jgi:hypothetical protein